MKSSVFLFVFSIAVAPALAAYAAPYQDLDRISDIVNQARGLADSARTGGSSSDRLGSSPATAQRQFDNPFSHGGSSSIAGQTTNRPQVGIGPDAIQINAGGRQLTIPRVGGTFEGDDVDPQMAAPARDAVARRPMLGQTANAALKTANDYRIFGEATRLFRNADFASSLATINQVKPDQAIGPVEQFRSLCLFANGNYLKSAEVGYAALARAPFYSWEQLRNFYGDPNLYAQQYSRIQAEVADHETDPSLRFLLGYHHLMLGHRRHAAREFEFVLTKLPNDPIVGKLLTISQKLPPSPVN